MASNIFGLTKRARSTDLTQNIRKYIDKDTLFSFTPECRHQIAVLEEELFNLHCQHQEILRKESEIVFILHDLILQEKYMQLNIEKRHLQSIQDKPDADIEREKLITEGLAAITERRDCMLKDLDVERLREKEEDQERTDYLNQMKNEWSQMKMENYQYTPNLESLALTKSIQSKKKNNHCIII